MSSTNEPTTTALIGGSTVGSQNTSTGNNNNDPTRNTAADSTTDLGSQNETTGGGAMGGEDGYPPQLHAGKVGLGPEYGKQKGDAQGGIGAKITGIKEEIKGTITRNPELKEKGHERMTGELQRKAMDKDQNEDPFSNPEDKHDAAKEQAGTTKPEGTEAGAEQAKDVKELNREPKVIGGDTA